MSDTLAELASEYEFTPAGLHIPPGLPFADWEALGRRLVVMHDAIQWAIADWLAYGEREYGEQYAQAIDVLGLSYQTLANYAWVGRAFESSRRRESLTFSHHAEVAGLPTEAQDALLSEAEAAIANDGHALSTAWLREEARRIRGGNGSSVASVTYTCPACGHTWRVEK